MNNADVQKLIQLREFVRKFHTDLGETWKTSAAMTTTKEVAVMTASVVNSLDELLEEYVTFKSNENS